MLGDHRHPSRERSRKPARGELLIQPLLVSLGDPAGVGPEIVAGAWRSGRRFACIGDPDLIAARGVALTVIAHPGEAARLSDGTLPVLARPVRVPVEVGRADPANAEVVVDCIESGVAWVLDGSARALVTAPIAKAPLYAAGFRFPGHTEFIAELTAAAPLTGTRGPVMMLTARDLRVALVTIHEPLNAVPDLLTEARICRTARVVHEALVRDFGIARPRLALAGLNPHAGEAGAIGREEIEIMIPAARRLREEGLDIGDPRPADTLFHDEARAGYDAVICGYHDQGLIPVKTLDFWGGVNVSLGLPIVRTSPDHGTGFDIAGKGLARPDSLIAALDLAEQMARNRLAA